MASLWEVRGNGPNQASGGGGRWLSLTIVAFWWLPPALAARGSPLAVLIATAQTPGFLGGMGIEMAEAEVAVPS